MKHIHIISPSGSIDEKIIRDSVNFLQGLGYMVSVGGHAYARIGRFAGADEERVEDISVAINDESVDVLLCSRGGYGLQRIVREVAKSVNGLMSKRGKLPLLVGFSDITILHQLWGLHGQVSLHASMCKFLSQGAMRSRVMPYFIKGLEGRKWAYEVTGSPLNREGEVESVIVGGNLSVLYGLQGTEYGLLPLLQNTRQADGERSVYPILLIEDVGENHYHIERMLLNFKYLGVFKYIGGLIVGQFTDCLDDSSMGQTLNETIATIVAEYSFPVCYGFPVGHIDENYPLYFQRRCRLSVAKDKVKLAFL